MCIGIKFIEKQTTTINIYQININMSNKYLLNANTHFETYEGEL